MKRYRIDLTSVDNKDHVTALLSRMSFMRPRRIKGTDIVFADFDANTTAESISKICAIDSSLIQDASDWDFNSITPALETVW